MNVHRTKRSVFILHLVLAVLEIIAASYMLAAEGMPVFRYYTVDSNMLQLVVSLWYLVCFIRKKDVPPVLAVLHLVSAVCLTVTFMIAAFVLMPQSTFSYYFLKNVASINHFFGPVLSVISLMLIDIQIPKKAFIAPAAATLLYGGVMLILNMARVLEGPYFFLEVYKTPLKTVVMWFAIIFLLCIGLALAYMALHQLLCRHRNENR